MSTPLIEIKHMDVAYQKHLVLTDVSLSVFEHDFIGIIGPNGGGKTSLVKAILGLLKPRRGSIKHTIERSEIGYLPQGNRVDENFPITVKEVISVPCWQGPLYLLPDYWSWTSQTPMWTINLRQNSMPC